MIFLIFLSLKALWMFFHHSNSPFLLIIIQRTEHLHTKVLLKNYISTIPCSIQFFTKRFRIRIGCCKRITVEKVCRFKLENISTLKSCFRQKRKESVNKTAVIGNYQLCKNKFVSWTWTTVIDPAGISCPHSSHTEYPPYCCEHDQTYLSNLAHYGDDSIVQTRARAPAFAFSHPPLPLPFNHLA